MANKKPLTDADGEVSDLTEWTKEDFARAIPFSGLPESLQVKLSSRKRGSQKTPTKEKITIRLSPHVVMRFRSMGKGWQGKVDEALEDWLKRHPTRKKRA